MNSAVRVAVVASAFVYAAARALHAFGEAFDRQIVMVPDVPTNEYRAHEVINGKCIACGES